MLSLIGMLAQKCRMTVLGYEATRWGYPSHVRLRLRKQTSEPITATHNDLFVGNVSFAIRKRTFAATNLRVLSV